LDAPHFIQVGDAPVFSGPGAADLACECRQSILIKGYLPASFLAIGIKCFHCGAITRTPGLPEGEILPHSAVCIEPKQMPIVASSRIERGTVLVCQNEVARSYGLTRPRDAPAEPMLLSHPTLEALAAEYDRLTAGLLAEHMAASPSAEGPEQGGYPFAWAVARLRPRVAKPGWSWLQQEDDAMAAMHLAALRYLAHCWGQHPVFARLASPLAERDGFRATATALATAKLLFDAGNRVGLSPPTTGRRELHVHFSTALDEPLSLAVVAPDALQWRERHRRSPQVLRAAVVSALAAARGRVNSRRPGLVVVSASILQPDFDQAVIDSVHAAFRAVGRQHRGVAALAVVMPKILLVGQPDRMGFGYAFYPIRNPHFAGENPIRIGGQGDFDPARGQT
jgi:hypothetical protein